MPETNYTIQQAQRDIATLRGQIAHLQAAFLLTAGSSPPQNTAGATLFASSNGDLQFVSGADGNTYNTGRLTFIAAGQSVTSTTAANVTGISGISVAARTYRFSGVLRGTMGSTGSAINFGVQGPATSAFYCELVFSSPYFASTTTIVSDLSSIGTTNNSFSLSASASVQIRVDGYVTFSSAGSTFGLLVAEHTSSDSWTLNAGYLDLMPNG